MEDPKPREEGFTLSVLVSPVQHYFKFREYPRECEIPSTIQILLVMMILRVKLRHLRRKHAHEAERVNRGY